MKLVLLLCLAVTISTLSGAKKKYHLIMNRYSWPIAQNYCRTMYNDLATIVTDDDWLQLNKEATSKGYTGYAWIGLYDDVSSWCWSFNNLSLKDVTYTNWQPGGPNNYNVIEACALIFVTGIWGDVSCTEPHQFICYNATFSGKFIHIATPLTWPQAQSYCRTHHTDLASSLNSSDQNILTELVNIHGISWIGLNRDTWKWSDGTIASNLPWAPGEPNNYFGNEECASHINNLFNDFLCSTQEHFYCYTNLPVRKQQINRLQLRSYGSGFDPAMQVFILEQIKKKLEEKGMLENSTVAWRVQPDGNIFHKKNKEDL